MKNNTFTPADLEKAFVAHGFTRTDNRLSRFSMTFERRRDGALLRLSISSSREIDYCLSTPKGHVIDSGVHYTGNGVGVDSFAWACSVL